ncbi:MAG TPA: tyrosine-type recombinase/integrase [Sphingobium sp.]|nr:tyrosine-type recombinase/integrase [Sphingobium sp.]
MALDQRTATALVRTGRPGMWAGKHGLQLVIAASGAAAWSLRYTSREGRRRLMKMADLDDTSAATIAAMEAEAAALRQRIKRGFDPLAERNKPATHAAAAHTVATFKDAALDYIGNNKDGWRNAKHREQWSATMDTYAFPFIGAKPVHLVTIDDVKEILLQPHRRGGALWTVARETASRVRSRIEIIIKAAKANALADNANPERQALWSNHHNPARWDVLKYAGLNGRQSKSHFAAMPWTDVPHFSQQLKRKDDYSARALLLTIMCATRSSETLNAEWSEFDLESACWTIPAERMKGFREHRVPLSAQAVELLRGSLRMERNPYVFPGAKEGRPLSNMSMLMMLRGMRSNDGFTVHGFRSAFRDWAGETTLHPDNITEQALAHIIGDKTVAAYRRGDAFERRRKLMQQWNDYLFMSEEQYKSHWEKFIA